MDTDDVKAVLVASCFVAGLLGGLLPMIFLRFELHYYLDLGEAFAGGILIAAGLTHLLSDSVADMDDLENPTPFVVCGASLLSLQMLMVHVGSVSHASDGTSAQLQTRLWKPRINCILVNVFFACATPGGAGLGWALVKDANKLVLSIIKAAAGGALVAVGADSLQLDHQHDVSVATSGLQAVVLFIGLAVHSFIAGIALGLQDRQDKLYQIFIAIIAHKLVAAYSLGQNVLVAHRKAQENERKPLFANHTQVESQESTSPASTPASLWPRHISAALGFTAMGVLSYYA